MFLRISQSFDFAQDEVFGRFYGVKTIFIAPSSRALNMR
jgi:hypothetical protein